MHSADFYIELKNGFVYMSGVLPSHQHIFPIEAIKHVEISENVAYSKDHAKVIFDILVGASCSRVELEIDSVDEAYEVFNQIFDVIGRNPQRG